jgi:hypothetical protein
LPFFFEWLKQVLPYVRKGMGKPTYTTFQLRRAIASNIFYNMPNFMFGSNYRELKEDVSRLKTIILSILNDIGGGGATLLVDLISEVCRFGVGENHIVASIVGGIASQKAIKVNFKYNFKLF